jgi:hypothetical protein
LISKFKIDDRLKLAHNTGGLSDIQFKNASRAYDILFDILLEANGKIHDLR